MATTIATAVSDSLIEIVISSVPFYSVNKKAFWGWKNDNDMLTEAQIIVLQGSGEFPLGETVVADFRLGAATPMYLFMAERSSEPVKTKWFATSLDQGDVAPGGTFFALGVVAGWRVYRSTTKTQFSTTTEFRVS